MENAKALAQAYLDVHLQEVPTKEGFLYMHPTKRKLVRFKQLPPGSLIVCVGIGVPKNFIPFVQSFGKKAS